MFVIAKLERHFEFPKFVLQGLRGNLFILPFLGIDKHTEMCLGLI